MCGRFVLTLDFHMLVDILKGRFDIENIASQLDYIPRYNIAPSQQVLSIIGHGEKERMGYLGWGFVPSWARDEKFAHKMINARGESVETKPAYKDSFLHRRCLILANGFYEWKKEGSKKTPMFITVKDEELFCMAGLYSIYYNKNNQKVSTCTVLTTTANEFMSSIHDRMPVILDRDDEKRWIDMSIKDSKYLKSLIRPMSSHRMSAYEVSSLVNSPKNDSTLCMEPMHA